MCINATYFGFSTRQMGRRIEITLGYYPKNTGVTPKLLDEVNRLLDEKGYDGVYAKYILKSGLRSPYKRITFKNTQKLINALKEGKSFTFLDKS